MKHIPDEIGIAKNNPNVMNTSYVHITPKLEMAFAVNIKVAAPVRYDQGMADQVIVSTPVTYNRRTSGQANKAFNTPTSVWNNAI